ncbi:MAG: DUF5309 family protein [Bifidobacterium adolescentis]|nr:DUF5309 family protein [Bifidobacterium adolescentis]
MPGITGMGTTYNLPNYVGELFAASREDTPLLSAIGGLTGGRATKATSFEWQGYDLRDPDDTRQRLEGADAPDGEARTRYKASNVVEIHQEAVNLSYTKQGATGQLNTDGAQTVNIGGTIVPADELSWQISQQLKQIARDVEYSFIKGTYANPDDNTSPRRTRGLLEAITTNVMETTHTAKTLTADDVLDLAQMAWDNGGIRESETRTIVVNSDLKRALTRCFVTDAGYKEETRNVGGVNLQTIETDFGRFNIMLDAYMPKDKLLVLSLEQLAPRFLEIPGKGHFFVEPLAKTGASDKVQIYGEIGLEYGDQKAHALLTVAPATASTVKVTGVTLSKKTASVKVGARNTVTAQVVPDGATNKKVTWASDTPANATVTADNENGSSATITGVKAGTAKVTATTADGAKTATVDVTVSE